MQIEAIALKHLLRSRKQFFLLYVSVAISMTLAVLLSVVVDGLKTEAGNSFDEIGPNIIVKPQDPSASLSYESVVVNNKTDSRYLSSEEYISINTIERRKNIASIAPKILQPVRTEGMDFILAGIYFQFEKEIKKWWKLNGEWPFRENEILLGNKISEVSGKNTGDHFVISGKKFLITGVLESQGTEEDEIVFANILTVQKLFGLDNKLSFIEVAAYCTTCPIQEIARQIEEKIPEADVIIMGDAVKAREATIDKFAAFSRVLTVVVLILGFIVVSLMMISNVNTRTNEIGVLRSIGYRRSHIVDLVLIEAAIVGLSGGVSGYLLGMISAEEAIKLVLPSVNIMEWNLLTAIYAVIISTVLGIISGIIPALKAAGMDPVESIKHY